MMRNFGPKKMLQIFFGPFQSPFPTPNSLRQCDQILQIWLILANFKIVAILRPRNDKLDREKSHVLVLRRLDQIRLRTGYHNVYAWNMLEPLHSEGVVLDTSVYAPSVHMCEVAQFQCLKSGTVFVPICGNLSF